MISEERTKQGGWDIFFGGISVGIGIVAILATAGAATPVVVTVGVAGTGATAYGISEITEGGQEVYYGATENIEGMSLNPLRDTIFLGNEPAYQIFGSMSEIVATGGTISLKNALVTGGKVTINGLSRYFKKKSLCIK